MTALDSRAPLIGISTCLDERGRWRPGRSYVYSDRAYADAVLEAGGIPVHLACPSAAEASGTDARRALVERTIGRLDALLLPGGDDFLPPDPGTYPATVRFDAAPTAQIEFDRALLAAALAAERPVLGICYGMQLIALHYGGTLHYDLAYDHPAAQEHQLGDDAGRHAIDVAAGSRLAACLGYGGSGASIEVNSQHHQAVAGCGLGLSVSARSADGVIEAIEAEVPARWCLGVQWHPEKLADGPGRAPIRALVEAAR